jgi:hypothetical protein
MKAVLRAASFFAALVFPGAAQAVVPTIEKPIAVLRALDKITARVEELDIPIGQPLKFGTILITVRACRATPPEETPESAAFLEVSEFKPGEKEAPIFHGWMFTSSPALSAMEHPIYDIWVIGCKGGDENAAPASSATSPTTPAPNATPPKAAPAAKSQTAPAN